jgi:hypothetical protein
MSVTSLKVKSKELSAFNRWSLKALSIAQLDLNSNEYGILKLKKRGVNEERIIAEIEEEWSRVFSVNDSGNITMIH